MKRLKNGIIMELVALIATFLPLLTIFTQEFKLNVLLVLLIFHIPGIYEITKGIKELIFDKKNEICYGFVFDYYDSNEIVSENINSKLSDKARVTLIPKYKITILFYSNLEKNIVNYTDKKVDEYETITKNMFVKLKYYKNNIKYLEKISFEDIPSEVSSILYNEIKKISNIDIESIIKTEPKSLEGPEEIVINGVKYRKKKI